MLRTITPALLNMMSRRPLSATVLGDRVADLFGVGDINVEGTGDATGFFDESKGSWRSRPDAGGGRRW